LENYIDLKDDFLGIKVEAKVNDNYTADFLLIIRNRMIDCLVLNIWLQIFRFKIEVLK
jgi:hypothetical protein